MLRDATFPILLIVGGLALLAWNLGWIPEWNTLVAVAFILAGIAVLVFDGVTKKSVVAGPVLIAAGIGWYGYFELAWRSRLVIPLLMIFAGFMMLIARFAPIAETKESGALAPREKDTPRF
ncbi:MAG: hypothetical protein ACRDAM_14075 [Casimicrobium sp.]